MARDVVPYGHCESHRGVERKIKLNIPGNPFEVPVFRVRGRHIIDTMILAALYDTAARRLPSLKLKAVALALGVQDKDRVILQGDEKMLQKNALRCGRYWLVST